MSPEELNGEQSEAVRFADGAAIIAAGPGTGKTRTLAHRIAHLITEKRVALQAILAVTFTRSAAGEMKERLKTILSGSTAERRISELWVDTFHAVALRILREERYPFGDADFSVLREEEKPALLEGRVPRAEKSLFLDEIRALKQELKFPDSGPAGSYQRKLFERRLVDFDDLFLYSCRLFDEKPDVLERWRCRFQYILVDEFQDTSYAQYELLNRFSCKNLCVIGDPDQAIYGFAGRPFYPFDRFKREHPEHRLLPLSQNYRSQASILEAAKQVIGRNRAQLPRELKARMERGLPIEISAHATERQEAEMIVRRIESLLGGASHFAIDSRWAEREGESLSYGLSDIVVLYRFHAQARAIERALERAGLPYLTYGKTLRKDGRELTLNEDLEDFRENAGAAPSSIVRGETINLMTMHRCKGLEFPVVFLAGCEEGLLPYCRSEDPGRRAGEIEEERRLFYVGMTRARCRLLLSYAQKRFLFGKELAAGSSPFLTDIEEELRFLRESKAPKKRKQAKDQQPFLFNS